MLRRNEGFFLGELLLSISVWLLAIGVLYPFVIKLTTQSLRVNLEAEAVQLLYDELQTQIVEARSFEDRTVDMRGYEYRLIRKTTGTAEEVCVQVEGKFQNTIEKCAIIE